MLDVAPDVREVWQQSWVTPWVWPAIVAYNVGLGVVFLVGGADRITGPSFATIRVVGHVWVGMVFLILGLGVGFAAYVSRRALTVLGYAVMLAHLLLAAGFVTALLNEPPAPPLPVPAPPRAALTGPLSYLFIAAVHAANARLYGRRGPAREAGASA